MVKTYPLAFVCEGDSSVFYVRNSVMAYWITFADTKVVTVNAVYGDAVRTEVDILVEHEDWSATAEQLQEYENAIKTHGTALSL